MSFPSRCALTDSDNTPGPRAKFGQPIRSRGTMALKRKPECICRLGCLRAVYQR